jgi:TetR/AcrR family transcriptional regulator
MSEKVGRLAEVHLGKPGLPRGPHRLPPATVRRAQRERLVRAALSTVADLGYGSTTVREIVRRAGVSLKAFYEHFHDKQDCLLTAIGESMQVLPRHLGDPAGATAEERLRSVFRRPLEFFAAEPEVARAFHLELRAAGPEGRALYFAVLRVFAGVIREWHERESPEAAAQVAPELYRAAAGGSEQLVTELIDAGRTDQLPELAGVCAEFTLGVLSPSARSARS